MSRIPSFKLTLEKRASPHVLETKPRYDVLVNGEKRGELYYNMRGYRGALRDVHGYSLDLGEAPITAYRREVASLNREAKAKLAEAAADDQVVLAAYEATEPDKVLICYGTLPLDAGEGPLETRSVRRRDWEYARILFGTENIPASFLERFETAVMAPGDTPEVDRRPSDKVLCAIDTEDPAFIILGIGPAPEEMRKPGQWLMPPDHAREQTRDFVWLTRSVWQELAARAGRNMIDAVDLPLIENRTLSPEYRPAPRPAPEDDWVLERLAEPAFEAEEEDLTGPGM